MVDDKKAAVAAFFMSEQATGHLRRPFDGRMNQRMAAPAKNRAPIIALSRALTGKEWDSKPPISPGQSQQTVPTTAKAMASISLKDARYQRILMNAILWSIRRSP